MTAQLIVKCPEHLAAVREFADRTGQRQQFESRLSILLNLPDKWTVELDTDFLPYSFTFVDKNPQGRCGFTGGLVYHGPRGGNVRAVAYSVTLSPSIGWRIHVD
jgi:hypothetical protein